MKTLTHECQHVDSGACVGCHEPRRILETKRVATKLPSRRHGKIDHKTPVLLRAAMRANHAERVRSSASIAGYIHNGRVVPRINEYQYLA